MSVIQVSWEDTPYERDGCARCVAPGCKLRTLVLPRVSWTVRQTF